MSLDLGQLSKRIRDELPEVEHTLKRAMEGLQRAKQTGDDHYLDGVALNLPGVIKTNGRGGDQYTSRGHLRFCSAEPR